MFVELIESLRCPRDHVESPLIASAERTEARHIETGILGCPVCHAEFPIREGEAIFDSAAPVPASEPEDAEVAMRLAAFLELTDARGFAILCGPWGAHPRALASLSQTPVLLVNPPLGVSAHSAGALRVSGRAPLAARAARAAALHGDDALLLASVTRAVRPGGRLVGSAATPLPAGVRELARDARTWVAEKTTAPEDPAPRLVTLARR